MHLRKILCLIALVSMASSAVLAQTKAVLGRVVDQKGDPVSNATVSIKGTSTGTTTDDAGQFSIAADPTAILVISSVGFATSEISATQNNPVIHLASATKALDEVVVVAYGSQKKSEVTSAISTVSAATIKNQQITTIGQALQGTAAGVIVVNSNGQPGENPEIRIRGVASLAAGADPLYVVDGIVFNGNLNMINPGDIESFSVLKDASATALYGSRAANGVILINTKKGRKGGQPEITLSASYGVSSRAIKDYSYLNTHQHFELGWEAFKNYYTGDPDPAQEATESVVPYGFLYNPYGPNYPNPVGIDGKLVAGAVPLWNDDWTKALTNDNAARRNVTLGISGGTEKSKYFLSAGYLNQDGYVAKSGFERINTRFNYTSDVRDWLTVGVTAAISSSKQNYPEQGDAGYSDVIQYSRTMSSVFPIYMHDDNGNVINGDDGKPLYDYGKPNPDRTVNVDRPVLNPSNVVGTLALDDWSYKRLLTDLDAYGQINFTKNFYFKSSFGIDRSAVDQLHYENRDFGDAESVQGRVTTTNDLTTSFTWNNMLAFDKRFGEHHLELMASYEAYQYNFKDVTGSKTGFAFPGEEQPSNAAIIESLDGHEDKTTLLSVLARVKYDFAGKYFIELMGRNDKSSIFAPGLRSGFFPSAGVSWVLSQEGFLKANPVINLLKLRASYGLLGNNALNNYYVYLSTYSTGYPQLSNPGVYLTNLANPTLQWERNESANIGVDFELFNSRLSGSLDVFNKSSLDLLFDEPLSPSRGFGSITRNIAKVKNSGIELNLDYAVLQSKNVGLNVNFNISTLKNKIVALLPGIDTLASSGPFRRVVGKSINEFYVPIWAGVDPATGAGQWYGPNGSDGKPTKVNTIAEALNSQQWVGSGFPKMTGGLGARLRVFNFDVNVLFNYAFGGKYYDGNYSNLMHGTYSGFGAQMSTDELRRWQKPGDITDVPLLDPVNPDYIQYSTRFLFSGDYVRLRNVTLGYTINPGAAQHVFKSIRVYAQADNLFTWDKLKQGSDPESALTGNANSNAFPFKTISAGLDLVF